MKKLQVLINGKWEYVFCHNPSKGIITTEDKEKALPQKAMWADSDLSYFTIKFANHEFRLE